MTSLLPLRVVIELGRPSLRLLLLCRSNFLDVIHIKRDRRGNTAKPDGDHAVLAARISDGNGGKVSLGNYQSEEDAARAYDKEARVRHGAFAILNFSEEV